MPKRAPNPTGKGGFRKGQSGNPGGMTAAQAQERRDLREALEGEGETVHGALMDLVRGGNAQAVLYAHQQLIGKPEANAKDRKAVENALASLTAGEILAAFGIADEG